ncbi:alpha/beta fold hydrolase [Variovorax sp. UMC13]|uniref:alpha/beta fold hydrolase n=1 Tax=Variovorax sp. UMC13 TaxID=1862326 RepID=UPI0021800C13|nr:alpha/beta hydrolase [Variovorax sp. UMC13]MBB1600429.1 alpha/beta hydrolase [Variovorax sp. UMC13]
MTVADVRRTTANGLSFHVRVDGPESGPLVVLLHGFPETGEAWRRLAAALSAEGWRVVVPDQRGYGLSDKPKGLRAYALDTLADDVLALCTAFGHARFAVVGHDWGGVVAWHLAARDPRRVQGVCILNAPHPASLGGFTLAHPTQLLRSTHVGFFQIPGVPEWLLAARDHALLQRALTGSSRPGTFDEALLAAYGRAWAEDGALTGMLNWYRALVLARPIAGTIEVPVQVIWGDRDRALEAGLAEAALRFCRQGMCLHLPQASHWVHHEEPERVGACATEFLHSVAPPTFRDKRTGPSPGIKA